MKYWEIIANNLSAAGWSWGVTQVIDEGAHQMFVIDAQHIDSPNRFIVRSHELLTAFLELESATRNACPGAGEFTGTVENN